MRNDGIYYGTKADEVNELKASWKQPCRPRKDDGNESGEGDGGGDSRSEPTGTCMYTYLSSLISIEGIVNKDMEGMKQILFLRNLFYRQVHICIDCNFRIYMF